MCRQERVCKGEKFIFNMFSIFMIHVIYLKAEILAKQAVGVAKTVYGESHLKYADSLIDYG